jgi:hypothetical protein
LFIKNKIKRKRKKEIEKNKCAGKKKGRIHNSLNAAVVP